MRLLSAFTRGAQEYYAAFFRRYEAVPSGTHKRAGQAGPVQPAMPRRCRPEVGQSEGGRQELRLVWMSSLHPSCDLLSSSLIPPAESTSSTPISCADVRFSPLHHLPCCR